MTTISKERKDFRLKKRSFVRFETGTFAVPAIFVTSKLNEQEKLTNLNALGTRLTTGNQMSPEKKLA